jgi:uncharacterized oligopeptide transporter (OPT) family protein
MVVARIPLIAAKRFRNLERQNYVISMASSAGFAAANCGFIAIATMVIMGRDDLLVPIALGALAGSAISVFVVGRIYDSKIFPAGGAWPMGAAVASTIEAGDEGGKKGFQLLQGLLAGSGAAFFGLPAAAVGIAFIANMFSTAALGLGMILRGYSVHIFGGFDIGASNIAQGVMIGAGAVALVQIFLAISKGVRGSKKDAAAQDAEHTVSDSRAKRNIALSAVYFMGGAVLIALLTGIFADMGAAQAALWTVFSGLAAIVVMLLVGTASMHSGWAPTFAIVTICMTIGIFAGFPPLPLAVMVGYLGSVGPVMADTGISLKTGWIIRGKGTDAARELAGRRRQVVMKQLGVIVGIAMSVIFGTMLIRGNVVPPMSIFYADAVASAAEPALLGELALWAIPGAALQAAFGNKSVGLMLATGLLINNPIFGIALLAAIAARLIIGAKHMAVRGPGLIAGDGLFGFGANILRVFF